MKFIKLFLLAIILLWYGCSQKELPSPPKKENNKTTKSPQNKRESTNKSIKIATLIWPPYINQDDSIYGITADIVNQIAQKSGYNQTTFLLPWVRVLEDVENGNVDIAYPAYYSKERAEKYLFSKPIAESPITFMMQKGSNIHYINLQDLKRYKIGIVREFVNTEEFDTSSFLQKEEANSDLLNIRKLAEGRVDLIIIDKFVAHHLIKISHPELSEAFTFIEPPLEVKKLHIICSKKHPRGAQLIEEINRSIDTLREKGDLEKVYRSYITF